MDLVETLKRPEGKTLEFKRDLSSPDGALRTLVAFANTAGGTLLIGVEDATRQVRGVKAPLDLEERLASMISDSIAPRLAPELDIMPWRRTHLLAVQMYPSPGRPHYLKREGPETGVYVRVGSTNRRADREMIDEMRRFARGEAFDEQAMPELDSEALDFRAASESFAPLRKLKRVDLETLRLVTVHQGRKVPTVGGVLLFGRDRARDHVGAAARLKRDDPAHRLARIDIGLRERARCDITRDQGHTANNERSEIDALRNHYIFASARHFSQRSQSPGSSTRPCAALRRARAAPHRQGSAK